jgi:hypothetical protein
MAHRKSPKLTAAKRRSLPKSQFGLPGRDGYPVDTPGRAQAAKGRATQAVKAGRMSESTANKIRAKADRKLRRGKR